MRLLFLLTLLGTLQSTAHSYGQATVTLNLKNESLEKAFKEITRQTGYTFIYTRAQLKNTHPISAKLKSTTLKDALDYCFQSQPLSYAIDDKYVVLINKPGSTSPSQDTTKTISGKVVDENGTGLLRISVTAAKSKKGTYTDEKGEFILKDIPENEVLEFTSVGYDKVEVPVHKQSFVTVTMKVTVSMLDEALVMAYGKTSRRFNTGSISKVSSEEIAQQPVSDPLAALHGKVPGLVVAQTNGIAGSLVKIQIRGQNSLTQGSEPLIILDGIPLAANNQPINNLVSIISRTGGGLSPLSSINSLDIESIEILKDADATAIYGSRGANGVVLISTKKGNIGKTQVFANFYTGWSKVTKLPQMLNTAEYVEMRKEAIKNDGFTPNANPSMRGYAPDLLIWDTTRETNFSKMLLGQNAHKYNGQIGFSGGGQNIQFYLSSGFNKEETIFSKNMGSERVSVSSSINYSNENRKFSAKLITNYSYLKNNIMNATLPSFFSLPPNTPPIYTTEGKLNWEEGGYYFGNPMANFYCTYSSATDNLLANFQVEYKIAKGLSLRSSFGYNSVKVVEESIVPIVSQVPRNNPQGQMNISDNSLKGWIIEPQAEYETLLGNGKINILIGSTFSENKEISHSITAGGYKSDNLLKSLSGASWVYGENFFSDYKYASVFGRINYNFKQRYIINLTGRGDASSRFGPGKRLANFGAIGAAWLLGEEQFMRKTLPFINYSKMRVSYGVTGNDQIGNYNYLDTWSPNWNNYQGNTTLAPTGLFNPVYGWETNKKFEVGMDFEFFKGKLFLSSSYYINRSNNQLVDYAIPSQTGFSSVLMNFPALVQNNGLEFELMLRPIKTNSFTWGISSNISFPKNKLVSFKDINSSAYYGRYIVGESLNVINVFNSLGVDPLTGVFLFEDYDKDNSISMVNDFKVYGSTDPKYYGGIRNTFTFKQFEFDAFFDFKKQTGLNYLYFIYGNFNIPGMPTNQPKYVLDRWQKQGDITEIQKFTTITYSPAYAAKELLRYSNAVYSDASFIRLKTASISWMLPSTILKVIKTHNSKLFISAQNLFTITSYKGTDPEVLNYYALPTLKTFAVGFSMNF